MLAAIGRRCRDRHRASAAPAARPGRLPDRPGRARSCGSITIVVLAVAVRRTNATLDERSVPLLGVMAAFIFAAQMFNFQVIGGTSGHLLGGVLAAVLLGPWAATLVMACVDRGPGAGVPGRRPRRHGREHLQHGRRRHARRVRPLRDAAPAAGRRGPGPAAGRRDRRLGVGRARRRCAWRSSSRSAARRPLELALPAMVGVHVLIGIGEALITVAALAFIARHAAGPARLRAHGARGAGVGRRSDDRQASAAVQAAPRGDRALVVGRRASRSPRWS